MSTMLLSRDKAWEFQYFDVIHTYNLLKNIYLYDIQYKEFYSFGLKLHFSPFQ